jgi:hypothetical protein
MKGGKQPPNHFMSFAPADWITSKRRARWIVEADHVTRLAYLELLFALHNEGGRLHRSDFPAAVGLAVDLADRALKVILECRGAIQDRKGYLTNPRVTLDLKRLQERSETGRANANKRWGASNGNAVAMPLHRLPNASVPSPLPSPSPSPVPSPSPSPTDNEQHERQGVLPAIPPPPTVEAFGAGFNEAFNRRLKVIPPDVRAKWEKRLRDGWKPWQLVALPILVDAQGLTLGMRKSLQAEMLLRDGSRARTQRDGTTSGATDWASRAFSRVDQTHLQPKHVALATRFGVLEHLLKLNVIIDEAPE